MSEQSERQMCEAHLEHASEERHPRFLSGLEILLDELADLLSIPKAEIPCFCETHATAHIPRQSDDVLLYGIALSFKPLDLIGYLIVGQCQEPLPKKLAGSNTNLRLAFVWQLGHATSTSGMLYSAFLAVMPSLMALYVF